VGTSSCASLELYQRLSDPLMLLAGESAVDTSSDERLYFDVQSGLLGVLEYAHTRPKLSPSHAIHWGTEVPSPLKDTGSALA